MSAYINEAWYMGGYGVYVWSAYGMTLAVFAINLIVSLRERKKIINKVKELDKS